MTEAPLAGDPTPVDDALLDEIEVHAVALARAAGEEATRALSREIEVEYKTEAKGNRPPSDPVSEIDHAVERTIRVASGSTSRITASSARRSTITRAPTTSSSG